MELDVTAADSKISTTKLCPELDVSDYEDLSGMYIKGFVFESLTSLKPLAEAVATNKKNGAYKVLIIGNSITVHEPSTSLGWLGNWGMAATAEDKDYAHILEANIRSADPDAEVEIVNVWDFERYFYDLSLIDSAAFRDYVDFDADIIVSAFGANINNSENEDDDSFVSDATFGVSHYEDIISYFNPYGDAKVIPVLTTLTKTVIADVIKKLETETDWTLVDVSDLTNEEYTARPYKDADVFTDAVADGVLNHPGDEGMRVMAERIWEVLQTYMEE